MAYVRPSVLVYQDLANAGGVPNSTPDLEACIIGPTYNTLTYVPGSVVSQVKTAAMSTTSTTGSIAANSTALSVASVAGLSIGDNLLVIGAGDEGANLQANVTNIVGNVLTLDASAGTAVTDAVISKSGKISNATVSNAFVLPGQKPGQVIDASSIKVWISNAKVETLVTGAEGFYTDNTLTVRTNGATGTWSTGGITAGQSTLTLAAGGAAGLVKGDSVTVAGAGAAGALLTAKITDIVGDVLTITPAAGTTVAGAAVTKVLPVNLNSTTNSLRVEAGDQVVFAYTNNNAVAKTMTTAVKTLTTSSGQNGTVVDIDLIDALPKDLSFTARGGISANGNVLAIVAEAAKTITAMSWNAGVVTATATAHGLSVGDPVTIAGVTPAGYNGVVEVTAVPDANTFRFALVNNPGAVTVQGNAKYGTNTSGMVAGAKVLIAGAGTNGADFVATVVSVATQNVTLDASAATTVANARVVVFNRTLNVSVRKTYNNQQVPATRPISGGSNFDTSLAGTDGKVTVNPNPELSFGAIVSADVYMGYKALRTDLANRVLTINDVDDLRGQLGTIDDENPLALGCQLALANTTGRVRAIAVESNDLTGYLDALNTSEGERVYSLTPLTQDTDILAAFKAHVVQMSTPENAAWRVAVVNSAIPTQQYIGQYTPTFVNANSGNNNVSVIGGKYVLTSSNSTFISDGVAAGDIVYFTASTPSGQVGAHQVLEVVSNQQLVIQTTATSTGVSFYISRTMSKTQSAEAVADFSETMNHARLWHVQPDLVGVTIDGVTKFLPGYYLCAALSGMVAGFPVQQGFTNIGVAGIADLKNSNFHFSKAELNRMAEAGTCLFVQESQGGLPYCRHELTTDMTVLEYREMLVVKNWDYLSYFYHDKLKGFIGSWNITSDTMNTIRQTITAASELVKAKKLPKIGAPLLGYKINKLEQNAFNKDNLDVELAISVVYPLNYLNLHLVI
jgi:hypothetical protein